MEERLKELLALANTQPMSQAEREEQLVHMAAANGNLTDQRITVATVQAARTILLAADEETKAA